MNDIIIRKAQSEDMEKLLSFEQGVIKAERPFDSTLKDDPLQYYDIPHMINADTIELVVAEIDNTVVGCGYVRIETSKHYLKHKSHGYFGFMYVDTEYRGKGINNKIIDALAQWAGQQGIYELRLDVYHDNTTAIHAYEKAGFTKHMIEMRKPLSFGKV